MAATSASELEPVAKVTARLKALLQRAKAIKPGATVEPALPIADFADGIEALQDDFEERHDQTYRYLTLETASRDLFYSLINSTDINNPSFVEVWNLLDIVLLCGDLGKCTPELICWLLEELLDSQTTQGCRTVFDYLDSRRERLAQKDFHKKNLVFLRSCNELLRRLSRAEDAIFCGRVFFFLFQTFPLGDKSSVNLRGEFHTENTTKFDVPNPENASDDKEQINFDSKPRESPAKEATPQPGVPGKPGSKAIPIKAPSKKTLEEEVLPSNELYPIFWRLQHDFSDPTRLFDANNLTTFKLGLASTIAKFKKTPTVVQTKAGSDDKRGTKRKLDENGTERANRDHHAGNYNPKYLTSHELFDLELSDLAFQRHILVQALILVDFLLSLTEKAKKRLADSPVTNRALLYSFTLNEEDTKWATSCRSLITSYLDSTADGKYYSRMVEAVLARDKNWVRWKVEGCPSIVRGPVSTEQELAARKGARDATRPHRLPPRPNNAMDLSFLEEGSGSGLEALKDPVRYTAPTMEQLVDRVKTEKLDMEFAADEDERLSYENTIQNAKWRAIRQARSSNLSLLDKVESTKDLEEILSASEQVEVEAIEENGDDTSPAVLVVAADTTVADSQTLPTSVDDKA